MAKVAEKDPLDIDELKRQAKETLVKLKRERELAKKRIKVLEEQSGRQG